MTYINSDIPKATVPTKGQLFGGRKTKRLVMFKKRGCLWAISDYAIALGGSYLPWKFEDKTNNYARGIGCYWSRTEDTYSDDIYGVEHLGHLRGFSRNRRDIGVILEYKWSEIKDYCSNIEITDEGVLEADYGLFPDNAPPKIIQEELNEMYNIEGLIKSDIIFTIDSNNYTDYNKPFVPYELTTYEYKGNLYTRVQIKPNSSKTHIRLSNEELYQAGDFVWICLKPAKLLIDVDLDKAESDKILIAGFRFTDLMQYLEEYFSKEIFGGQVLKVREIDDEEIQDAQPTKRRIRFQIPKQVKHFLRR